MRYTEAEVQTAVEASVREIDADVGVGLPQWDGSQRLYIVRLSKLSKETQLLLSQELVDDYLESGDRTDEWRERIERALTDLD